MDNLTHWSISTQVGRVCGDTLYCHGGLHVVALTVGAAARRKRLAKQNKRAPAADAPARELLAALNADAAAWLRGAGPLPAALGASESSPVWSRAYSRDAMMRCSNPVVQVPVSVPQMPQSLRRVQDRSVLLQSSLVRV